MRIAQMGHTDIKTTKQFYEFDRETNAEKAQKLGEIEELRLLFEDVFFVPPRVLENLPFVGLSRAAQENSVPRIERNCLFGGQSALKQASAQRHILPETSVSAAAPLETSAGTTAHSARNSIRV